jgi:excisionase family DNA binding protein
MMLSVNQVAELLNVSPSHVRDLIDGGELPATNAAKRGSRSALWRVEPADVESYKVARSNAPAVVAQQRRRRAAVAARRPDGSLNRLGL